MVKLDNVLTTYMSVDPGPDVDLKNFRNQIPILLFSYNGSRYNYFDGVIYANAQGLIPAELLEMQASGELDRLLTQGES